MNYYLVDSHYSNSTLSYIKRNGNGIVMNPELLRLGSKIDEHLFDGEEGDEETAKIIAKVREDFHFSDIVSHPEGKAQHEWYGTFYGLPWRCKFDFIIRHFIVLEFKSSQVKNTKELLTLIDNLDYDRQIFVYMECAKLEKACILAVQKKPPHRVTKVYVQRGDDVWNSGKRKTEYLINILKGLICQVS